MEPVSLDLSKYPITTLARQLGQAWADSFAGDPEPSYATVHQHKAAVVDFLDYCRRAGARPGLSCLDLTVELLDAWEDDAASRYPPSQSRMAGQNAGILFALVRSIAAARPGTVAPGALGRARKPSAYPNNDYCEPLCEFSRADLRRLVPAAIASVSLTDQRIHDGRRLLAEAEDPRRSGHWGFANVVWLAARGELSVALLRERLPRLWRCWDGSLRERAPKVAGDNSGGNITQLVRTAYRHVFPHPLDLVGHLILITPDTAAWPEGVKDLTVEASRVGPGTVRLELMKNRLPGSIEKLAADTASGAGAKRFRDTGSVLRSLLNATEAARESCGSNMAFVAGVVHPQWEGVKVGPVAWSGRSTSGTSPEFEQRAGLGECAHCRRRIPRSIA